MSKQSGFTIIEAVVILAVLVILGTVGYMGYNNFVVKPGATDTAAVIPTGSSSTAPIQVKTSADLNNVSSQLDAISLDDSDSTQLNSSSSF